MIKYPATTKTEYRQPSVRAHTEDTLPHAVTHQLSLHTDLQSRQFSRGHLQELTGKSQLSERKQKARGVRDLIFQVH